MFGFMLIGLDLDHRLLPEPGVAADPEHPELEHPDRLRDHVHRLPDDDPLALTALELHRCDSSTLWTSLWTRSLRSRAAGALTRYTPNSSEQPDGDPGDRDDLRASAASRRRVLTKISPIRNPIDEPADVRLPRDAADEERQREVDHQHDRAAAARPPPSPCASRRRRRAARTPRPTRRARRPAR